MGEEGRKYSIKAFCHSSLAKKSFPFVLCSSAAFTLSSTVYKEPKRMKTLQLSRKKRNIVGDVGPEGELSRWKLDKENKHTKEGDMRTLGNISNKYDNFIEK